MEHRRGGRPGPGACRHVGCRCAQAGWTGLPQRTKLLIGNDKTQESPAMAATTVPTMEKITATEITAPPAWAVLQRRLIGLMEQAAPVMSRKYADRAGTWYWSDDICLLYTSPSPRD